MADQQKVHPMADVEAPPTTPLVAQGWAKSEKGSPIHHHQQQHHPSSSSRAVTSNSIPPAVPVQYANAIQSKPKRRCCCKCICWAISLLVLVLVVVGISGGILYLVFQPKIPKYSIDSLRISDLRLNLDMTLYAKFDVKITANNPNKKIGIYYEKGGRVSVWYTSTRLCEGSIPKFYQGHQNITRLVLSLTGQSQYGSTLLSALQVQQQTGSIPLTLKVDAPVAVQLGTLKLNKVRVSGDCVLALDSLTTNNLISIKTSDCKFRLNL